MGKFTMGPSSSLTKALNTNPTPLPSDPIEIIKEVIVERIVEIPVDRIVEKEVIKEVPVEKIVEKQIIKEIPIEKLVEKVVKEIVYVDRPFEVIKEITKHVPVEIIKEVEKEVKVIQRIVPKWAMMVAAVEFAIIILLLISRS